LYIHRLCNMHGDSYVAFERKKNILSCTLVVRDCYYLPPLSPLWFLFTNELSASSILVLCSDQKFINISHEKMDIKIEIKIFFFKNWIEIDENLKSRIVTALQLFYSFQQLLNDWSTQPPAGLYTSHCFNVTMVKPTAKGRHGVLCRLKPVWSMPERFKVVCTMQGAIQVLCFAFALSAFSFLQFIKFTTEVCSIAWFIPNFCRKSSTISSYPFFSSMSGKLL